MALKHKTRFIFVTGGVVSSLGKGITAASIGLLLKSRGFKLQFQKLDPYLNVDPGTMNPYQHGEVFITADGAETDLDLGHYERYTGIETTKNSNFTAGQIYTKVISDERKGSSLGQTIQVVPHITNEIKKCIAKLEGPDIDFGIVEIGGTVGDIEGLPFIEALRQFNLENPGRVLFLHVTLIPFIRAAGELKTKPTQHSVAKLREIGIQPDILVCRTEEPLNDDLRAKLSLFCSVQKEAVIEEIDIRHNIYEVPMMLAQEGLDRLTLKHFNIPIKKRRMAEWDKLLVNCQNATKKLSVAVIGKYIELQDAYKSIYESLQHAAIEQGIRLTVIRVSSEDLAEVKKVTKKVSGVLIPGGFGSRGIEGKILAARICRENKIPYFGICMGMQVAAIEFAQNVCKLKDANSLELDPESENPIISLMENQKNVKEKGGTMRLGNYPCLLSEGRVKKLYRKKEILERHRHRFEFNDEYKELFMEKGMLISGVCPENGLVEILELTDHPWYVGCQFHPEFKSRPVAPHPLFSGFIAGSALFSKEKHG